MCFVGKAFFSKERFVIKGSKVLIMGLTYKEEGGRAGYEGIAVREMVKELKEFGVNVYSGIFDGKRRMANEKEFYYSRM